MKTIIVGGVAGGASCAARLRRLREKEEIVIYEKGNYISFANCGMPYYVGGVIEDGNELLIQTPESFKKRFNIDVNINSMVTSINKELKKITVKNTLTGEEKTDSYDRLVLATGSVPIQPDFYNKEDKGVFYITDIDETFAVYNYLINNDVKEAVVIGGGYIGIEMVENLCHRKIKTSVVEMSSHVIKSIDKEMAALVHNMLKKNGVSLYLKSQVTSITKDGKLFTVEMADGRTITCGAVIIAIGVRPNSSLAVNAGLEVDKRGYIIVDKNQKTSDNSIYAVGDVIQVENFVDKTRTAIPLAGPANKQGRICADVISGLPSEYRGTQGSSVLKVFDYTVASTGINEEQAKINGTPYDKIHLKHSSHASYYPNSKPLTSKILFDPENGRILGGQFIGEEGVEKRCDVLATAIRAGMTGIDLTELELCYAPPYSSAKDPVNMAGYVIDNIMNGRVKNYTWDKLNEIDTEKDFLLDARTVKETSKGMVKGAVNIPLDSLRERINEVPKDKKIYVYCLSGLRSYIASCILAQEGYDCYNISGGYYTYGLFYGE